MLQNLSFIHQRNSINFCPLDHDLSHLQNSLTVHNITETLSDALHEQTTWRSLQSVVKKLLFRKYSYILYFRETLSSLVRNFEFQLSADDNGWPREVTVTVNIVFANIYFCSSKVKIVWKASIQIIRTNERPYSKKELTSKERASIKPHHLMDFANISN